MPFLVACGTVTGPPLDVETTVLDISTDRSVYSPGEDGTVRVSKKTDEQVIIAGLCEPLVDRWDGFEWQESSTNAGSPACLPVSRILRPGQSAETLFALAPTLDDGHFRLRFTSLADSATGLLPEPERVSRSFQVR